MNTKQRITALKSLISDGISLGFATPLILGYSQQLTELKEEVKQENAKRKARR